MKKKRILSIYLLVLIIAGLISVPIWKQLEKTTSIAFSEKKRTVKVPTLKIIDEKSDSRPVAVMINNHNYARKNHSGLQDAFVIYEMIVEGGITRLMAIYKDKETDRIGSVRSSRHNFLDYASEYDAIYVHFGWSNLAKKDISSFGINNINGLYDNKGFWRDKSLKLATEHTAFTSMDYIQKGINKYGYRTTTKIDLLLNYSVDEIDISKMPDAKQANKVFIDYSASRSTTFEYDTVNKVYLRSQGTAKANYAHKDAVTKKQYTAKNIITYQLPTRTIDSKGRQEMNTVGAGKGFYITNGYAVPITWEKTSRASQTKYRYLDGKEINVNDGNTYIEIQPTNKTLTIE